MPLFTDYYGVDHKIPDILGIKETFILRDGVKKIAYTAILLNQEEVRITLLTFYSLKDLGIKEYESEV